MSIGLPTGPGEARAASAEEVLDISVRRFSQVHVIKLKGNFRLGPGVDEFRTATDSLLREGYSQLAVNLAEVPMMDSSAIGVIVRLMTSARSRGGNVKLVNPSKLVLQTLKMVGLLNIFEIFEDDTKAIESYGASATTPS